MRLGISGALAALLALLVRPALAQLPTDGEVSFSYTRAPSVTGCSQTTEEEVRDLTSGVMRVDPFVPAGQKAPSSIKVAVTRGGASGVRAELAVLDRDGGERGVSIIEDRSCDGAHLKLVASIALLLRPRAPEPPAPCPACPPPACDEACRAAARKEATEEARRAVRAEELPALRRAVEEEVTARLEARSLPAAVISAGPLFGFHHAADPAPGFWLAGEARWEHFALLLEARGLIPSRAFVAADGASASMASLSGIAAPCLRWRFLGACALLELGSVWASGPGSAGAAAAPVLGFGARTRIDVPLGAGFEARVFGDGIGHALRLQRSGVDTSGGVAAPYAYEAPLGFSVFLGMGIGRAF